ncbi:furin-like protease 1 isoform X1 [Venturia canescens]|uniref:furin-like protease 1 isoform X1 n=1 Tax=Venturia canescens TaxID=32260 RepID=UPI001C9BE482|nr:furin-like protease 1 isoform X1 [Venturia canescens]XP_043281224.1 furin-like protease 1 isoform X1 [Venturia canescens]XP_043281225.1 furin-like protease 1 isoform X1 [Venturia canescens]
MCVDKWILTFGVVAFGILGRAEAWTHQWAAHIEGGSRVARQVAEDHGFIYADPIIGDWHHLVHRSVKKRSTEPHLEVHRRLTKDPRVRRAEQQRAKSRSKRDLIEICPESPQIWFNDKGWPVTWYANRGHCLDMNVIPAWREGITGRGVVISILDDGLETDHPDLIANYDRYASYDVNSHDDDPMPRYDMIDSNRHGTRCAGEVAAAANNSICSVGIAYGASIGGVRMLDGDVTDAVEAKSLSHHPQHIDIYSASWGPDDDGKTVDGPGELATRAFNEGITKGRKGKGSIFIWASGNGGRDHDNCNCDGYTNSIWTLSISSATENGLVPWYSEACSSTLATTYSSGSTGERQVVTTDLHHQCTNNHTGTSASAPLAAGICALALEANPNLTWRDMQHIVVRTARPENLKAPDWITNGVRRNVSHSFGYGLMDAAAMVRLARKWKTVPEQKKCEVSAPYSGRQIPAKSQLVLKLDVRECTEVNYLEHVQAKISLTAMRRGDLQIQLTSPNGTRSTLLAKRPHDNSKAGFNQWPFMSVHTWGEMPHGVWKLEIHNEGRYLDTLEEWNMVFYGTEKALDIDEGLDKDKPIPMPPEVPEIVNENTDTYGIRPNVVDADELPWTGSQKVDQISHPEVQKPTTENQTSGAAGCIRNDTRGCLECDRSGHLYEGLCLTECPKNTYPVSDDRKSVCSICHYSCESCSGGSNNECKSCHSDATLISMYNGDSQCIQKSLEWKSQSTKWFYYMSILLGLNLTLAVGVIIYLYLSRIVENRNNQNGLYNYNKLLSPEEEKTKHEEQLLPARNGCLSDSD